MLHDKTKLKVKRLFEMGDTFCDTQLEKYSEFPDVLFVVDAFGRAFNDFSFKLRVKKDYTLDTYHEEIYELDSLLSAWREHLVHNFPNDTKTNNDLYDVLFSVLQGVETLCDDDHFAWEEDEDEKESSLSTEEQDSISDHIENYDIDPDLELSCDDEHDYIERTF